MKKTIRLIVADDHELLRLGYRTMLRKISHITLIDEAQNGEELVRKTLELRPDVVITDINMPVVDGLSATRQILRQMPALPIIALTMFDEENLIVDMLEAGAKGYIVKTTGKEEIVAAINTVMNGSYYYCETTSARLAKRIAESDNGLLKFSIEPDFTRRELEIIRYLCQQHSSKEISVMLNLSQRTIESHRERIFEKMNVKNVAGMVIYAIRKGLYKM